MKATEDQVAAVLSHLWGYRPLQRHAVLTNDYVNYEWVDQVPELGRQLGDALSAEGLEIGGLLRTDQGEFFAGVVERISPPLFTTDERLIVDVLTEASRLQTAGKQAQARPLAIAGILLLVVLGLAAAADKRG